MSDQMAWVSASVLGLLVLAVTLNLVLLTVVSGGGSGGVATRGMEVTGVMITTWLSQVSGWTRSIGFSQVMEYHYDDFIVG